jgi:hypothetical protein
MEDRAMRNTTLPTHATMVHPITGQPLRAVGLRRDGRPIWPIMGASAPIPGGGQPPAAPPATGTPPATQPAPNGTPPAGQGATPDPADEPLGEAGKQTLVKVRKLQADAEARATAAEDQLAALKAASQTDQEKAVEAARTEGLTAGNQRLIRAEVKAAAAHAGFHDPVDAAVQLADQIAKVPVTKDGDVDEAKVKELIAELATAKPYLLKAPGATPPAALPGQGNHQPAPKTGSAAGKAEAEKRFGKKTPTS